MEIIVGLVLYLIFCVLVDTLATRKGRRYFFAISCLLSPAVGLLLALCLSPNTEVLKKRELKDAKKCPACAEIVKSEAAVCRYCGHKFASSATPERLVRVARDGRDLGSMSTTEIRKNISAGALRREDYYFDDLSNDWVPLDLLIT